tara:strand:+ start:590 stop:1495 length:906 start_codon:yes stop_codon:yes gene_type:complete
MKIDTLVLSGGSTKVPAYIGCFRALKEFNIINDNLDGIKHIISCSVGMLYALLILLKVSKQVIESFTKRFCFSELLDIDNLNINNLIFELGLFDNCKVGTVISTILREIYSKETMTLQELYDLTNIKLTAKVVNHTKACIEYMSYENEPNLSITTLLLMTTAIPLFFKPIKYRDCLYVDGGTAGGFATEIAGDNYIGIHLKGPWKSVKKKTILDDIPIIDYFISGLAISVSDDAEPDSKKIVIPSNIHFTNFKLTLDEKQTLIDDGYNLTKQHIKHYKLTNDLLNEQHHEDLIPTEGGPDS